MRRDRFTGGKVPGVSKHQLTDVRGRTARRSAWPFLLDRFAAACAAAGGD
jgi:hypothetical protein